MFNRFKKPLKKLGEFKSHRAMRVTQFMDTEGKESASPADMTPTGTVGLPDSPFMASKKKGVDANFEMAASLMFGDNSVLR